MGRPEKHDTNQLLESAMALFWEKGYGVPVSNLVEATGVLAGSLYGRFGNKEGLFIACLHHYAEKVNESFVIAEKEAQPLYQVKAWFEYILENSVTPTERNGCFVMNTLLEHSSENGQAAEVARSYVTKAELWIENRLKEAKKTGELNSNVDCKALSICLYGLVYSLRGMSRAREPEDRIRSYMDYTYSALLDPWRN